MATRKAPSEGNDEELPPSKRRCLQSVPSSPLNTLNDDCLLRVLSFSTTDDLNTVAMVNRRLCAIRAHSSLNQERTGIIHMSNESSMDSLFDAIIENAWDEDFQGNRTKLKITGMPRMLERPEPSVFRRWILFDETESVPPCMTRAFESELSGVTSLDLTCNPSGQNSIDIDCVFALSVMLFDLEKVNMSNLKLFAPAIIILKYANACVQLRSLEWNGQYCLDDDYISLEGVEFEQAEHLSELLLDNCRFAHTIFRAALRYADESPGSDLYILRHCRQLERLSIKSASFKTLIMGIDMEDEFRPITQGMLIKMVRHHTTLRWLRSDLSADNITMLQKERPEITFVTE